MLKIVIFGSRGQNFKKKCCNRIGTGAYSIATTEKKENLRKKTPKKGEHLILMCIFLNNVPGSYSIATTWNLGFWTLFLALLRGSAGNWPDMGQHGPKHYKSRHFCQFWGSEMTLEFLFGVGGRLFYRNTLYIHTLHYITLHYITLHYITLHYITYIHTYVQTYIHIHKSMGGTHFAGLRVKQGDAPRLNNGTRFISHYETR